jgi:uncharacterized protein YjbI with pentapeptide repeats
LAQKPKAPDWLIENIAEASKNARRIYFLYIGFLGYCALTVVSTSDRQIILNETVNLPILKIDVSLNGFFLLAPLIGIFIFAYFQFYLNIRKELINELRADYPSIGAKRLYPWMLVALDFPGQTLIHRLQSVIVKFSVWCSLPLVLALISTWFVKKHDPKLSYIIGLAPIVGTIVVLWFWCQYEDVKFRVLQVPTFVLRNWGKNILLFVVIAYEVIFLSFIIPLANEGFPEVKWYTQGYTKYLKSWFCVNLSYQKLVAEPKEDYEGVYWRDLSGVHLEGADLTNVVLKRTNLENAHLSNAILADARLEEVNLVEANLQQANLGKAKLQQADLKGADLQKAHLGQANLQQANLGQAKLQKADLRGANLQQAILFQANLQQAHLGKAKLQKAILVEAKLQKADLGLANLKEANLRVANLQEGNLVAANLQEANLVGANLQEANLVAANLQKANLEEANLQGARNLTVEQLCKVRKLYKAKLDSELLEQIKEKYPHLLEMPKPQK